MLIVAGHKDFCGSLRVHPKLMDTITFSPYSCQELSYLLAHLTFTITCETAFLALYRWDKYLLSLCCLLSLHTKYVWWIWDSNSDSFALLYTIAFILPPPPISTSFCFSNNISKIPSLFLGFAHAVLD